MLEFDHLQNCLLGKDAAILRFHPTNNFAVGQVILYQPLDVGHPSEVWYQAKVARVRETGYLELEPFVLGSTPSNDSAFSGVAGLFSLP